MITLQKQSGRDFIVLNLSDPQLSDSEWESGNKNGVILTQTVKELVKRLHPDLITVSGDIAWAGQRKSYRRFADLMESFSIPWAPIWGNHDNQGGAEEVDSVADEFIARPHCVYEKGEPSLGNGNYVIKIDENGKTIAAVIMMDTHDRAPFTDEGGKSSDEWAKLIPEQLDWYAEQIKALGGVESTIITHIPIYAYREAFDAAFNAALDPKTITPDNSRGCWNKGYEDSFGVKYEGICSYPADEGMFALIRELGSTTQFITGHDHVNNYSVFYNGMRFTYSLKAGAGCYWNERLNGGTVLTISDGRPMSVRHEFVDPRKFI